MNEIHQIFEQEVTFVEKRKRLAKIKMLKLTVRTELINFISKLIRN